MNDSPTPPFFAVWLDWPIRCFKLDSAGEARLRALAPAGSDFAICRSQEDFLRALPSATHALAWEFRKEWFALAPRLRVLATPSAGREWMPRPESVPDSVTVRHGRFHGPVMAETAAAFMLAHARGLYRAEELQAAGDPWPRAALSPYCFTLAGTRAVILGCGAVGGAVARLIGALGVETKGIRRSNIGELIPSLADADWLVVALPSDTGTDAIVSADVLAALPPRAVVINVGRGNAVDEHALVEAVRAGRIAGAYLDVVRNEPLEETSPLHPRNLSALRTPDGRPLSCAIRLLPHASAFSPDYLSRFFEELFAS